MKLVFVPIKLTDRLPDFTQRIFFYNSSTEGGYTSEYIPNTEIEVKRGKMKQFKDVQKVKEIIISSNTHWLEPTEIDI